ncbi:MAG: triphosphoribosyl-dephospho-CoA synthase [Deltaproteobacteria bacterium]
MIPLSPDEIAWAAQIACLLEVNAWKPGNVSRFQDFPECCFEDFLVSAVAIGPAFLEAAHKPVGATILRAVRDTHRLVDTNTNLGIVLLLAPLAKAAGMGNSNGLRAAVIRVLADLTVEDACGAYEAIRLAAPAGLDRVERCDVYDSKIDFTLREAMKLAQDRDSVAREYVTGFDLTFELGYATLRRLCEKGCKAPESVVQTFLTILAQVPDSLISRKNDLATARHVSELAKRVVDSGGVFSEGGRKELHKLNHILRDEQHRLNPGTTADLVAASLFVFLVDGGVQDHLRDLIRPPRNCVSDALVSPVNLFG